MTKWISGIFAVLVLLAAGCSDDAQFRVSGHVEGNPTMNLRVGYYSRGAYQTLVTAAREGDFEFFGNAPQPAVIEIFDYDNRLLGRGYISNGQSLEFALDPSDFYATEAGGNDESNRWSTFLRTHAEVLGTGGTSANAAIAEYIGGHRDDVVSTLLLTYHYDASIDALGADSLLELISAAARPAVLTDALNYQLQRLVTATDTLHELLYYDGDSARTFTAAGHRAAVLAIDDKDCRSDSIVAALQAMHSRRGSRLLELSSDADMTTWRVHMNLDSADWERGWTSAVAAAPQFENLGITAVPYFIVCDSVGRMVYRGPSATLALDALTNLTSSNR